MDRKAPYILITVLIAILTFILGVRYGQNVEKTNEKIACILSVTPTQPPSPSTASSPTPSSTPSASLIPTITR